MTSSYLKKRQRQLQVSLQKRLEKIKSLFAVKTLSNNGEISFAQPAQAKPADENGITVILNVYARPEYLQSQVEAIRNQSVPITELWIWCNKSEKPQYDVSALCDRFVVSNHNWKFFGRFTLALMAQTKYIALFDDDVLPGQQWLENCLQTIQNPDTNGILGGSGVRMPLAGGYSNNTRVGWHKPDNATAEEVDLVGHAWFLEKRFLLPMWREEPYTLDNGEDIHLSYCAQKYENIKTFVPPHPPNEPEKWSSNPIIASTRGGDENAHSIANKSKHDSDRDTIVDAYRANGWSIFNERDN